MWYDCAWSLLPCSVHSLVPVHSLVHCCWVTHASPQLHTHSDVPESLGHACMQSALPADRARAARRAQFDLLAERICSEAIHAAAMAGAGRAVDTPIEDQGVFRTARGSPFNRDAIVHWKRFVCPRLSGRVRFVCGECFSLKCAAACGCC